MEVKLIHSTPLHLINDGIRMCWNSQDKSDAYVGTNGVTRCGEKDKALIDRVANKFKHSSVLRHSLYVFDIKASTKTLLAFSRHKAGVDFSVQSSRYTTTKAKGSMTFTMTSNSKVNSYLSSIINIINEAISDGASDDDLAMLLPQSYEYRFQVSMNAQAIQHFLSLRTKRDAHWDIRELAHKLYEVLPNEHKYIFSEHVHERV